MRGFLFGFLLAAAIAAGGYYQLILKKPPPDPCRACSTGTRCLAELCVAAATPPQPVPKKRPGWRPRPTAGTTPAGTTASSPPGETPTEPAGAGVAAAPSEPPPPPPPPPPTLRPEDRRSVAVGDKLTGTEVINLAEARGGDHELSQEEIDAVFRPRQKAIIDCIDEARGEAQLGGQLAVAFRIQRSGKISGVRVEAPAWLIDHGLLGCVRGVVQPLSFPPSSKAQIVTYPFTLN